MTRLSVPSMFTSRYPCQLPMTRRTGVTNADRLAVDTMAEMLQRAGYETVAIPGGNYFLRFRGLLQGFRRTLRRAASNTRTIETRGRFVTQDAIEELGRARQSESPTFLWIHYDDAHAPHSAVPRAPRFGDRQIDRYDQEIWLIDQELRALFTAIDDNLADRDPLVILTADHGERFDPAGRSLKRDETLLEMTLHVPLVFWMRGLSPGRVHPPAALLDILPTIVDLTGIETHSRFEGRSLVPRMRAKPRQDDRVVFSELDQAGPDVLDMVSARRDHLLLIADRLRGSRRMYDLDRDPEALRPLALRPGSLTSDIARHVQRMLTEKSRRRGVR